MEPSTFDGGDQRRRTASAEPQAAPLASADPSASAEDASVDPLAACWSAATAAEEQNDPSFDAYVALASEAEKRHGGEGGDPAEVVRALELLLSRFPLCYGYWKKLAEAKYRVASAGSDGGGGDDAATAAAAIDAASEVFERGLAHVGSTPELWQAYASKLIACSGVGPAAPAAGAPPPPPPSLSAEQEARVRGVFERAVRESGDAWGAAPLWEAFASWEASLSTGGASSPSPARRAADVLLRGSCRPIRDGEALRARLHELAARHDALSELASSEEERESVRSAAGVHADADALRAAWLSSLETSASRELASAASVRSRRAPHEGRIRRTYWNSKPLDADQLQAWWSLLDDAEGLLVPQAQLQHPGGEEPSALSEPYPREEIDGLYRRCLVACAAYPEFWRRRARWLLAGEGGDEGTPSAGALAAARAAATAASDVHCRSRPEALMFASRLDESAGDFDAAREKLVRTRDVVSPGLAAAAAAVAHLDRRRAIAEFLESRSTNKGGKRGSSSSVASEEEAKRRGAEAARKTLTEAMNKARADNTAASLSCVAALSLQAAALTSDDGDVAAGREALSAGLRAAPGELAVWEAAATFEARWGGKATDGEGSPSAAAVAVAILQAAAAPPASSVPGLEEAIAEARERKRREKEEEGGGGGEDVDGRERTADDDEVLSLSDLDLPADAVRRARAAGFPLTDPFSPPGWPSPLPAPRLSHADRAALSARSVAIAEASSSPSSADGGGSGVALLREAAALHDRRFGYAQAAAANVAAGASSAAGAGPAAAAAPAGGVGFKRPYPGVGFGYQGPRPRPYYNRYGQSPQWQQQSQWQQQQQYWQQQQQYQAWQQQQGHQQP